MHALARQGFDGSGSSGLYDRARPTYPVPAIRALLDAGTPEPPAPLRIVELGAGTGICSRMLLEHATSPAAAGNPPPGLASLMAVEPSSGMREHFEKSIVQDLVETMKAKALLAPSAEVSVEEGAFEDFDVGQGFDLVVVAQVSADCLCVDCEFGERSSLTVAWSMSNSFEAGTCQRRNTNVETSWVGRGFDQVPER